VRVAPSAVALTKRQAEMMAYLRAYAADNGYAPTHEEIAAQFGFNSLATVVEHLTNLERKGQIRRVPNEARSITILT